VEQYEAYLRDPETVPPENRRFFEQLNPDELSATAAPEARSAAEGAINAEFIEHIMGARELARNIREHGHLIANIVPHADVDRDEPILKWETYGLNEQILRSIPAKWVWPEAPQGVLTAYDAVMKLQELYTGVIAYDFAHVFNMEERAWLNRMVESGELDKPLSTEEKKALLNRLAQVEGFEKFLHRTFAGQKRFSIEGLDVLVPMLDTLIQASVEDGVKDVMIGMAHRGRLNVLAHVLGKPYSAIFSEFHTSPNKELVPSEGSTGINAGWTGDVKYHLGASKRVGDGRVVEARLTLANNPSHLEFINPVVEGFTRAAQDDRTHGGAPTTDLRRAMAVIVHGDAAFPGEGVVAETFNFSHIRGYETGGTVHIIANNRLGFTAEEQEGRSTRYSSDMAKGFQVPVIHVNADHPEACLKAIRLAYAYRSRFQKDVLVDLIGYRRWGHNEMDDPSVTQPLLYHKIQAHPTVLTLYGKELMDAGIISSDELRQMEENVQNHLREEYAKVANAHTEDLPVWEEPTAEPAKVTMESLKAVNDALMYRPQGFTVYPKLERTLDRRKDAFEADGSIDWAHAEALAFGTILMDGTPIRLTGQDSERGTFAHRHMVLHDFKTNEEFVPLQALPQAKASITVHNSPLTETAVLGFEYGYSVQAPETLVLWEAQFGDFANVAQVIIDQFIASGRAKWGQTSGLVMLLPHGYEGQGPEHSSARLERYLQLAANNNMTIANVTSAAQYFHLLRRQAAWLGKSARPLVLMAPKSLLRNPKVASKATELVEGRFEPVVLVNETFQDAADVKRVVFATGKVCIDFLTAREKMESPTTNVALVKVEQLYPFPKQEIENVLKQFPNVSEVVWMQEEPENMGAWRFMQPKLMELLPSNVPLRYIGRPEFESPAEGHAPDHNREQNRILTEALNV
jgi:2-oxoglutarate dehydrogenase E1 component